MDAQIYGSHEMKGPWQFYLIRVKSRRGIGMLTELRGADFLQILDGAANDSIISEAWGAVAEH